MQTALSINVLSQQRAFMGVKVTAQKPAAVRATRVVVRAEEKAAEAEAPKTWTAPTLDPNTPSPIFGGSTGAYMPSGGQLA